MIKFMVVTYDITDDKRRLKVAKVMKNFGERVQLSVFEFHLSEKQVEKLQRRIERLIKPEEDKVCYYTLCKKDRSRVIVDGIGEVTRDWDYRIL